MTKCLLVSSFNWGLIRMMHVFLTCCVDELVFSHYPVLTLLLPALADALLPYQWFLFKIWIAWMNESLCQMCVSCLLLSCSSHPIQFSLYFPDKKENVNMQSPPVNGVGRNLRSFNFYFRNSESVKHFLKYPLGISIFLRSVYSNFWPIS